MPIELELTSNRSPGSLTLLDQYLAGEIGIMQLITRIECIKMNGNLSLLSWVFGPFPYHLPHRKLLFP
jgi:hypothetical protein